MRVDLADDPAVVLIANTTGLDEFSVVGRLHKFWSWADRHFVDGNAVIVTRAWIDRYLTCDKFAQAMTEAGWLNGPDGHLSLPHFDRHNGETAKKRALNNKRVADHREEKRRGNASSTESVTQISLQEHVQLHVPEKRREEVKDTPLPPTFQLGEPAPKKSKAKPSITLRTYCVNCDQAGADPIPADHHVFAYADSIGLPRDFLDLAWGAFCDRYLPGDKRQSDWPLKFRNSVEGNWFHLWWLEGSEYKLTTAGMQAKRAQAPRVAAHG